MRRALPALVVAAAAAVVAAGAAIGHGRQHAAEVSPLPSAESTGPRGLAAARTFLLARGRVAPVLSGADRIPSARAVLILAAPAAPIDGGEAAALLAHAARGGTLVWAAGPAPQPALARLLKASPAPRPGDRTALPLAPHPLFADLALPAGDGTVASTHPGALPVSGGRDFVAAISIPVGKGEVILLSGPEPLSNQRIGEHDALSLLTRLAARGLVAFDERWLHPRAADGSGPAPALLALGVQALLAALALLWARGRRLGAVRPPPPGGAGRTARHYLSSLAGLYRRAGAEEELARAAWRSARRRLERRAGVPARIPDADALLRLGRRSPAAAAAFERGLAALALPAGSSAVLAVVRAAADVEAAIRRAPPPGR